ncbi:WUSCHEL-related homeobox 11-like protein [Tanacetum coccineum]
MEDQAQTQTQTTGSPRRSQCLERNEPVRSRWTPKPEQILILESIFNSGMVNPPKEETVKIRKLLEKFGSVGDANVFYWFQNRRSRSRRRQRQIQASLISAGSLDQQQPMIARCANGSRGGVIDYQDSAYPTASQGFVVQQPPDGILPMLQQSLSTLAESSSSSCSSRLNNGVDEIYSISGQASCFPENTSMPSSFLHLDTSKVQYEFGIITVFINGVPTEVESGPLNIKAIFGEEMILVHSSGVLVSLDEYGVSLLGLQHGESYFLVSKLQQSAASQSISSLCN